MKTHNYDKVFCLLNGHTAKIFAWSIWTLFFLLITAHHMYNSLESIYIYEKIDFKMIKYSIMSFDLMCLGIVAIIENGKFPVRYLVLLPIIHYVFELIFFADNPQKIINNFIYLIISIIIYNSLKIFNDLLFILNEYVNYKIKKWKNLLKF